jgi:hypothetical protein
MDGVNISGVYFIGILLSISKILNSSHYSKNPILHRE